MNIHTPHPIAAIAAHPAAIASHPFRFSRIWREMVAHGSQ
jgi:hypothetical protein